ncbi:hypothetical protein BX666DRAFT_1927560 [Dichotomocladium elegans]|nr:hypothetical protein BX666DRAFT_1927560 [Dichotomocladium elegans]
MSAAGIDTSARSPRSVRSATSTMCSYEGTVHDRRKEKIANWNLHSSTFERHAFPPRDRICEGLLNFKPTSEYKVEA